MATHDYNIANGSGAAVRSDINDALLAISSNNSATNPGPSTTYAYQFWADISTGKMRIRNSDNTAFVELFNLDGTSLPSSSATEVVFNDAGADLDFRIEGDTEANLFFLDAGNDRVGIADSGPDFDLDVNGDIGIREDNNLTFHDGTGTAAFRIRGTSDNKLFFERASGNEHQMVIDDGNVGIGTTTPSVKCHVQDDSLTSTTSGTNVVARFQTNGTGYDASILLGDAVSTASRIGQINGNITFHPGSATERVRFDGSGNVGIGTTSPHALTGYTVLTLNNSSQGGAIEFKKDDTSYGRLLQGSSSVILETKQNIPLIFGTGTSSTERMRIASNGVTTIAAAVSGGTQGVIVNTTTYSPAFYIRGDGGIGNYSGNNVNLSDRNVKKDIALVAGTWDCLKEWEIVNFRYKDQSDDADLSMGVIAQQVAESCPEVVTVFQEAKEATETEPAQEERIGIKEQQMMWMAIKALQEAQVRIETLEAKVAALEAN